MFQFQRLEIIYSIKYQMIYNYQDMENQKVF